MAEELIKLRWLTPDFDRRDGMVSRAEYVRAKTKQLQEFGYPNLTENEVDDQVTALQQKKRIGFGLTVIGMFMQDEVIVE